MSGVWLIGSRWTIAVTTEAGVGALPAGEPRRAPVVTERKPFDALPDFEDLVFGCSDLRDEHRDGRTDESEGQPD